MRLRNVKDAKNILISSPLVVKDPTAYKGKWNVLFGNNNPIHIEIGMGKGDFIYGLAQKHADINFIGIEKYDSVLVRAVQKDIELPNLKLIRYDATYIDNVFANEVAVIYLNHSDPWPKERHAKRRLTSPVFLNLYRLIANPNFKIVIKTDNVSLYQYSLETLKEGGFKFLKIDSNYNDSNNILTEYEKRFRAKKQPIYYIEVENGQEG